MGSKTVYGYVQNNGGLNSGFRTLGTWTVNTLSLSVSPAAGTGTSQTFTFVFSDTNGFTDLATANVLFNTGIDGSKACFVFYDRASNAVFLLNDASTASTRVDLGTSATAQNTQCIVNGSGSSAVGSGINLTLNLTITFKSGFAGTKKIFGYTMTNGGLDSGFQILGTWTVMPPMLI